MSKRLQDYFIPHAGNDYRPHSLQQAALLGMTMLVLLSFSLANLQSVFWLNSNWLVSTVLPAVIVDLTNVERSYGALGDLQRSPTLDRAAQLKAQHMAANQYFSHNSPDGITPWHWFNETGYHFVHAGENLAVHFTDSNDVVTAWMNSPTHRANIMNGNFTQIGVGTAAGEFEGFKTVYVVQLLGTPAMSAEPLVVPGTVTAAADTTPPPPVAETVLAETAEPVEGQGSLDEVAQESAEANEDIVDVEVTEGGITLLSDLVSSSTGAVPATVSPDTVETPPATSWLGSILTSPHTVLQSFYSIIAAFVVVALGLAIVIEARRQRPAQVVYAVALLFLMYSLFELHKFLSGGAIIV